MLHKWNVKWMVAPVLSAAMGLTACSSKDYGSNENPKRLNVAAIQQSSATPIEKSERLAEAAERLLTPSSFVYANDVVQLALEQDPRNPKARLIAALIAPTLEMQGILTRIEPLVATRQDLNEEYKKFEKNLRQFNAEKAVTRFLFDGPADIHTEREMQEVLNRVVVRIDELRKTLRDLKDTEISIYINDEAFKSTSMQDAYKKCTWSEPQPGVYETNCDVSSAYERKMNRADFEALQQMAAGYQTYITVLNAWDLTGVYTQSAHLTGDMSRDLDKLMRNSNFGTLRAANGMNLIPEIAKDAVLGTRYALAMQSTLCPKGNATEENRPGYVFANGFCVATSDGLERMLGAVELMIQGQPAVIIADGTSTVVNGMQFFTHPIGDLRSLEPLEYNNCGNASRIGDGTLNGVFPTGDLNRILAQNASACNK